MLVSAQVVHSFAQAQSLDMLLGNYDWRERFVAVCLGDRCEAERNAVLKWSGDSLGGLRWEVISSFCKEAPLSARPVQQSLITTLITDH